jgi:hypothetical protein
VRERLAELLEDVRVERAAALEGGNESAMLVFMVLEEALVVALDSKVL